MNCFTLADTCSLVKILGSYSMSVSQNRWKILHDPNFQMKCGKENYGEGKGRLNCFSFTSSTSVTFCDTGKVKACCTTTTAKTMKLFNGWVPKPELHLQVTNKILRNLKKEAAELLGWQALGLLLASDRKSSFKSPSLFTLLSL